MEADLQADHSWRRQRHAKMTLHERSKKTDLVYMALLDQWPGTCRDTLREMNQKGDGLAEIWGYLGCIKDLARDVLCEY